MLGVQFEQCVDERGEKEDKVRACVYTFATPKPRIWEIYIHEDLFELVDLLVEVIHPKRIDILGSDMKPLTSDSLSYYELAEISLDGGKNEY